VRAASLNPADQRVRSGDLQRLYHYRLPLRLGSDLSGVVTKVGERVRDFQTRDEVFARLPKDRLGAFAERVALPAAAAARKPHGWTTCGRPRYRSRGWPPSRPCAGPRSVQASGSSCTPAPVGWVTFAIQLARRLGAAVVTTAGARNGDLVRGLGAGQVIDYRTERFDEVLTGPDAVDVVVDTQGGEVLLRSFAVVKPGGHVVTIGGMPTAGGAVADGRPSMVTRLFLRAAHRRTRALARRHRVRFGYLFMTPSGSQLAELAALIDAGGLDPVVDRTYPLDEVGDAFDYVAVGHATGKVVIRVGTD
jgi:NADPH:quinone reductase-like Zn-dependent oxidoreductase